MLPERYDPKEAEKRIQKFWQDKKIFKAELKSKKLIYSVDTPPPTISGLIHVGHAFSYSQAEFVVRFWRMMGYNIFYPMGFDDNGLPSERYVEKARGIRAVDMPREQFNKICLEETKKGGQAFRDVWERLGISVDWDLLYSTINPTCQKISQLSFIDLYKKNRVFRTEAPVTWCPTCQTAVAQAELEDQDAQKIMYEIDFKMADSDKKIVIGTTRPELLPACVVIFVHPFDRKYKELIGKHAIVPIFGQKVKIMADDKVDPNFGTGIVMVCTFGDKTDIEWWKQYNLPLRVGLDKRGRITELGGKYKGLKIEEARKVIVDDLKKDGILKVKQTYTQPVNVHDRCGTPAEYYVSMQWYIRILDMKEKWLELGDQIKWYPEKMKERYRQWVEGLNMEWAISRQRYFGIPFPVWFCKKCGDIILADEKDLPVDPLRDRPKGKCKCGSKEFEPEKDVMDTWATSAITPLINARWGEKKNMMKIIYPMELRPQAHDIIRTWAFYTIAKCYMHTGKIPWKSIMISGHGLDPHGKKMSKSKGNVVEPIPVADKYSADALRFWAASARLGEDMPYQEKDVQTGQKLINKLWNASRLVELSLKGFNGKKPKKLEAADIWILSKLNKLVKSATENFKVCEYGQAKADTEFLFWHIFCDNYLEMVKHRTYAGKDAAAQWTLYQSLLTFCKLFAPIVPHVTEEIYQNLFKKIEKDVSIHVSKWSEYDKSLVDDEIEKAGDLTATIISAIRNWKHDNKLPLNAELKEVVLEMPKDKQLLLKPFIEDILGTTKAKKVTFGKAETPVQNQDIKFSVVQ